MTFPFPSPLAMIPKSSLQCLARGLAAMCVLLTAFDAPAAVALAARPAADFVRSTASKSWVLAQSPPATAQAAPQPKAQAKTPPVKAPSKDEAAPRGGDSQLRHRVEQLEEQLTDMQVTMGTIESLGKGGGAQAASTSGFAGAGGSVEQARVESLETQIRALTHQVEQLSDQVRQLNGNRRGEVSPSFSPSAGNPSGGPPPGPGGAGSAGREAFPSPARPEFAATRPGPPPFDPARAPPPAAGGFGSVTVNPSQREAMGPLGGSEPPSRPLPPLSPTAANAGSPKELYETAYGYLLQQDYGAAEVAFEEFLKRHPTDRLGADAQYWLGETLFVQRRFKPAGQAFLRVIEKHQASAKVPNSMLKLAMTLEQLGQKDCGLFNELDSRASTPADIKAKGRALRQRVGC